MALRISAIVKERLPEACQKQLLVNKPRYRSRFMKHVWAVGLVCLMQVLGLLERIDKVLWLRRLSKTLSQVFRWDLALVRQTVVSSDT